MRQFLSKAIAFMSVPTDNPELLQAQYRALSAHLPMMYLILMTSTWALAATHIGIAPVWLTITLPLLLTAASAVRILFWWKSRERQPNTKVALASLKQTNRLAFLIALAFTLWSFLLFPYGDAYMQSHVAFYMSITVISCIFSLMHVRSAAITVAAIVNTSFIIFFISTGEPTFIALSANIALVTAGMLVIMLVNYRNFAQMVNAQVKTQALSNENLRLANIDSLPELPNRRAFFAELRITFGKARQNGSHMAIGIIDLDGFKQVNDVYGHSTGDKLLVQASHRLAAATASDDAQIFRLGGDEFAFVTSGTVETAEALGTAISESLQQPFILPGAPIHISGSVGIAVYPESALSPEALYEQADYAQYHGKRTRRGAVTVFTPALDAKIRREAMLEQALKQANLEEELFVLFQPIIDCTSGGAVGFEALARWKSPKLGFVPPSEFIAVAERVGFVGNLTWTLLQKALSVAETWPAGTRLSFNLSAQDLNNEESALAIAAIIGASSFSPHNLDLEITETAFGHDFEQICRSAEHLRMLGCGISIDDFGTGYSSLTRLHALPLTKIKIDRSFVENIDTKPASYKIVKSLLTLSRDMELDCVVEGVEREEELETLKTLGAKFIQGYLYSPPVSEDRLGHFLGQKAKAEAKLA